MKKNLIEGLETRTLFAGTDPMYINPPAIPGERGGDYQIGGRWSSTATNSSTGSNGSPITLTWGFVADGQIMGSGNGEPNVGSTLRARLNTLYGSQAVWQALFQSVFDRWSQVTGINYVFVSTDDGAAFPNSAGVLGVRPDVRIGGHPIDGTSNVLAYNYFPNAGDMVIDTDDFNAGGFYTSTSNNSRRLRNVIAHEHGHGIGLSHVDPVNQTKLMEPFASTAFDGVQFDDILAGQSLYGDILEKNGRNDTAATATDLGTLAVGSNQTLATQVSTANTSDFDYYKFTVTAGKTLNFTLQPDGTTYLQGPQNGATSSFNASAAGNLTLTLYNTNGTTVLQTANLNAAGVAETLTNLSLQPGSYYVRVNIASGTTQMYKLLATVVDGLGPPTTPDLAVASDLGSSSTDDITSNNTPTFFGTAPANTTVQLFDGVDLVGTGSSDASGNWSITVSTLSDGSHSIVGKTFDGVTLSNPSPALTITIDTIAPAISSATYDREFLQDVAIVFSEAVAGQVAVGDLTLTNTTTSTNVGIASVTVSGGSTIATVSFSPILLANGRYELTMPAAAVSDVAGNLLAASLNLQFLQLAGDATGNGVVDFDDLLITAQNYNTNGKSFSQGNFNYDGSGIVDFSDLLILAQNYNLSLIQAAPLAAPVTQSKRKTNKGDVLA